MKKQSSKGIALGLFLALTASPLYAQSAANTAPGSSVSQPAATREPPAQPDTTSDAMYGAGAALASIFYIPAKVVYAGLGLVTGGLGYVLSGGSSEAAGKIIYPAIGGNYVVTPSNLKGTEPLYFVGAPPPEPETQQSASNSPDSSVTR